MINQTFHCPVCGNMHDHLLNVTAEQVIEWETNRDSMAQNVFTELQPHERELFITELCYDCQRRLFSE